MHGLVPPRSAAGRCSEHLPSISLAAGALFPSAPRPGHLRRLADGGHRLASQLHHVVGELHEPVGSGAPPRPRLPPPPAASARCEDERPGATHVRRTSQAQEFGMLHSSAAQVRADANEWRFDFNALWWAGDAQRANLLVSLMVKAPSFSRSLNHPTIIIYCTVISFHQYLRAWCRQVSHHIVSPVCHQSPVSHQYPGFSP